MPKQNKDLSHVKISRNLMSYICFLVVALSGQRMVMRQNGREVSWNHFQPTNVLLLYHYFKNI